MRKQLILSAAISVPLLLLSGSTVLSPLASTSSMWSEPAAHAFAIAEMPRPEPENPFTEGRRLMGDGRHSEAGRFFAQAAGQYPAVAPYMHYLSGECLARAGDTAGAIAAFRSVTTEERVVGDKALQRLAESLSAAGRWAEATEIYSRIADRAAGVDAARARIAAAACRASSGDSLPARDILLSEITRPTSAQSGASAAYEYQKRFEGTPALRLRMAGLFYDAGDFLQAAAQYEKALAGGAPADAPTLMQMGRSYERADEFRTAIGVYRRLLDRHPSFNPALVRYRIGLCHQRLGEDEEGEKQFAIVLRDSPRSSFADDILHRMATRLDRREKRAEALSLYRRILTGHPRSSWADDAAWRIGFAHLEDGNPEGALAAFEFALRRFPRSDYAPAMGYWRGRILEKSGRSAEALDQYASILRNTSMPYYRVRAAGAFIRAGGRFTERDLEAALQRARDGDVPGALSDLRAIRDASTDEISARARTAAGELMRRIGYWNDIARFSPAILDTQAILADLAGRNHPILREIETLFEIGAIEEAATELAAIGIDAGRRPEQRLAAARLLAEGGHYRRAMREVEAVLGNLGGPRDAAAMPPFASALLYPRFYAPLVKAEAAKYGVDYRLVLAVIREESRFQKDVVSWAGAHGLMQIMPATGQHAAKDMGLASFRREMLGDPQTNIALGTFYLTRLLESYNRKPFLALAGYNAGPGNANRWLRQNPDVAEDFLIERISFSETRNYVKRVLGTWWTYRQLDGESLAEL